jgi:carboxypeptidase PM20D1
LAFKLRKAVGDFMPYLLIIIALLFLTLIKPLRPAKSIPKTLLEAHDIEAQHAVESLQKALQFATVSYEDSALENDQFFTDFQAFLIERYPFFKEKGSVEIVDNRGLLITLKGKDDRRPAVLMSHYDVVPVNGTWKHDPFSGDLIDDRIYGRGALDTKGTLISICEALNHYFKTHDQLEKSLYLAFGGDEEVRGASAIKMRDMIHQRHPELDFVLDEGGAVTSDVFKGIQAPIALVGLGEKGFMSVTLTVHDKGGHASMPAKETAITHLAKAVRVLNKNKQFKAQVTPVVKALFEGLYPYSTDFKMRYFFHNYFFFKPFIKRHILKTGGTLSAMMRTTQAFTMMAGSEAINVLPTQSSVGINYRLITGESSSEVLEKIQKALKKLPVEVTCGFKTEATSISSLEGPYPFLQSLIEKTWGEILTVPYLMVAATDGRHYHQISNHVYRFSAQKMGPLELSMIHSVDESILRTHYLECVQFYRHLVELLS